MNRILAILAAAALAGGCTSAKQIERSSSRTDLGVAYYREGNTESAVAMLREATEIDGNNWRAWNALAVVYVAKGETKLAARAFDKALRASPGEGETLVSRGSFHVRNGDLKAGIADFREALRDLDYRNPAVALSNLSYALTLDGDPRQGAEVAREALRRSPEMCEARYHLGVALERLGDREGAAASYRTHIDACPDRSDGVRVQLGCMLAASDPLRAAELLDELISRAPDSAFASAARACRGTP
jgi:type IV pilus assembly protein PilF